ncbi:CD4-2 molecule, tandem duplicate 2 isoform X2 [Lampris incognitus]|uniref:CD4-2 molecule, tandem duplicate 2 isoform X2 n=1 Tax=Lampris incognitus TaxID=2546036 RepID=UPI0024B5D154|nr:CD4-2 molecule, tandem duplicate 2 isoform X2 [Lampris incognitus]
MKTIVGLVLGKAAMVSRSKLGKDFLEINTVEVKDVGLYTCNVAGNPHHHRLGLVSVSVHPSKDLQLGSEATLQCQVKGLDPPPAVEWERPNSEPIRQATVQLTSVSGSDRGDWTCKFTHDGKMYNKTLEIRVEEPSVSTLPTPEDHTMTNRPKTTEDPLPNKKILGLSLWMWVALGVGFLILVILLVILCCRCRRMKRRAKKLKMVRSPLKSSQYCKCKCPTAQQPAAAPPRGRQKEEPSTLPRQQR